MASARNKAPKAPMGVGVGSGCPLFTGGAAQNFF